MDALSWLFGILSGVIGALGMGGGGVLIIFLSTILGVEQLKAQGINLLFFLPCAAVAIIIHAIRRRIRWRVALPYMAGGVGGVLLGSYLAGFIGSDILGKLFAALLIVLGLHELFKKRKSES